MRSGKTKIQPGRDARSPGSAGLLGASSEDRLIVRLRTAGLGLLVALLLFVSGCHQKLNYRDGKYRSAREMVRLKKAERLKGSRPVGKAPVGGSKVKVKTKYEAPAGGTVKTVTKRARPGSVNETIAAVIEEARSYTGTPYLFGGTTRLGLDCSALLQLSFAAYDIAIPRSSNEQAVWGEPVKPTELRPGDFLFFGAAPGATVITHVGMVTEASAEEIRFIHASTSLGVIENSFESDYYLSRFIRAVRPRL